MEQLATIVLALPVIYAVGFFAWRLGPRLLRGAAAIGGPEEPPEDAVDAPLEDPPRRIERMRDPVDGDPPLPRD